MYRIMAGDALLWAPTLQGQRYPIIDPVLTFERNKAATLSLTVPDDNVRKNIIALCNPEIKVYDGENRVFRGRVLTNDKDFKRSRKIYCEGDLAYLRDVVVRPYTYTGTASAFMTDMIGRYNAIMGSGNYKHFEAGTINVTGESITRKNDQYPDMLSEITDKLLNVYGGFLSTRCEIELDEHNVPHEVTYIDYVEDPGDGEQTIKYGKNLLDLNEKNDASPLYTRIVPLGANKNEHRVTISSVTTGNVDYIENPTATSTYGLIESAQTYDEIEIPQDLKAKGETELQKAINPKNTIEISAVDMSLLDSSESRLEVGKTYKILSVPHGYVESTDKARLTRAEIHLAKPAANVYTFGNVDAGITQEAVSVNRAMDQVTALAQLNSANVQELKEAVGDIKDYIDIAPSASDGWHQRHWKGGRREYVAYGKQGTNWTWTDIDTVFTEGYCEITLPEEVDDYADYSAIVSISGFADIPMMLQVHQSKTKIKINAISLIANKPTQSEFNVHIYMFKEEAI